MEPLENINFLFQKYRKNSSEKYLIEILKQSQKFIFKICFKVLKNEHESEDATQDVLIKLIHNIHILKKDSKLTSWINQVSLNQAIDYRRKNIRSKLNYREELDIPDHGSEELLDNVIVFEHIDQLPEKEKSLIHYRFLNHLSIDEIAKETNSTTSTVHRHIQKALEVLKVSLKKSGFAALAVSFTSILEETSAVELTTDVTLRIPAELYSSNQVIPVSTDIVNKSIIAKKAMLGSVLLIPIVILSFSFYYFLDSVSKELHIEEEANALVNIDLSTISNIDNEINGNEKRSLALNKAENKNEHKNKKTNEESLVLPLVQLNNQKNIVDEETNKLFFGVVTDEDSGLPIKGVKVEAYDIGTYEKYVSFTDKRGKYFSKKLLNNPFLFYVKFIKKGYLAKVTFQEFMITKPLKISLSKGIEKEYSFLDSESIPYKRGQLSVFLPSSLPSKQNYFIDKHLSKIQQRISKQIFGRFPDYLRLEKQVSFLSKEGRIKILHNTNKKIKLQFKYDNYLTGLFEVDNSSSKHTPIEISKPVDFKYKFMDFHTGMGVGLSQIKILHKGRRDPKWVSLYGSGNFNYYKFIPTIKGDSSISKLMFNINDTRYHLQGLSPSIENNELGFSYFKETDYKIILQEKSSLHGSLFDDANQIYQNSFLILNDGDNIIKSNQDGVIDMTRIVPGFTKFQIWKSDLSKLICSENKNILSGSNYEVSQFFTEKRKNKFKLKVKLFGEPISNLQVSIRGVGRKDKTLISDSLGDIFFDGFISESYIVSFNIDKGMKIRQSFAYTFEYTDLMAGKVVIDLKYKTKVRLKKMNKDRMFGFYCFFTNYEDSIKLSKTFQLNKGTTSIDLLFSKHGNYEIEYGDINISPRSLLLEGNICSHEILLTGTNDRCDVKLKFDDKILYKSNFLIMFEGPRSSFATDYKSIKLSQGIKGNFVIKAPFYIPYKSTFLVPNKKEFIYEPKMIKSNSLMFIPHKKEHSLIRKSLQFDDIILRYNGHELKNKNEFIKIFKELDDEIIDVDILRNGKREKIELPRLKIFGLKNHFIDRQKLE
ncbi:MAG: hypothetical protein COA79_20850 [Planctomycetota bacterium]|nr:MAG: hypothetical protein COA79_20850 [Planctomycetota bacterium]